MLESFEGSCGVEFGPEFGWFLCEWTSFRSLRLMQNGEILDCHDSLQLVALFAGLLLNLVMGDYSMCVVIWGMGFP